MNRQLVSSDEATTAAVQHRTPCADCPWARSALNGWLGGTSIEEWLRRAHSNTLVPCHTIENQQCAGIAIYRRNVMRLPIHPLLILEADKTKVFANPQEFTDHHTNTGAPFKKGKGKRGRRANQHE